ncbi:MAG: tRNA lysidine(34) synthetase TilS [Gemmatimonadetes bacterium]|nr:tRNA lysidine(34) synthetase TilS [Gemmatimonadota bacterium]
MDRGRSGGHAQAVELGRRRHPERPAGPARGGPHRSRRAAARSRAAGMTGSAESAPLAGRVAAHLAVRGRPAQGERVVVALSGGLDSLVLLHLLRFAPELPRVDVVAAHFDHRMRAESGADARWVAGLTRAWGVPLEIGAATAPIASEEAARDARYAFLDSTRARVDARWIVTAHHADDQAETVLFRVARGTGLQGMRGIPARRGPLLRPLLPFWRAELEAYARAARLDPNPDPSNADPRFARNVIRAELLPRMEAAVAPGSRRALVRLARLAAREERGWREVVDGVLAAAVLERDADRIVVAAPVLLGYGSAVRARVLRALVRALGATLDEVGTRVAGEFTRSASSGRSCALTGGVVLSREFDRLVLSRGAHPHAPEAALEIDGASAGEGRFEMGGRRWAASWSLDPLPRGEPFACSRLPFPLRFRGRRPGDRIRLSYGSKKLKKLLGEARIPLSERERLPVLVDGEGQVLWVPGVARRAGTEPAPGEPALHLSVGDGGTV